MRSHPPKPELENIYKLYQFSKKNPSSEKGVRCMLTVADSCYQVFELVIDGYGKFVLGACHFLSGGYVCVTVGLWWESICERVHLF